MMTLVFLLLLFAVLAAWLGKRKIAIYIFAIDLIIAVLGFIHHITTTLPLQL